MPVQSTLGPSWREIIRSCERCGVTLTLRTKHHIRSKRFCSLSCKQKAYWSDPNAGNVMWQCIWCGRLRHERKVTAAQRRFCSRECKQEWRKTQPPAWPAPSRAPKRLDPRACAHCGAAYQPTGNRQKWCPNCAPDRTSGARIREYGMSKPDWDVQLARQSGTCALCEAPPTTVDHDHRTGRTRGLLCTGCNMSLGFMDRPAWMVRARAYLEAWHLRE
jgi:hypothetical protein